MNPIDLLGYALNLILLGGFLWALTDLLIRIARQPKTKRRFSFLRLTSYPFVPDDLLEAEQEKHTPQGSGGLRLSPVPVRSRDEGH